MNILDTMTDTFEELFFKKYSHHVCIRNVEKELLESHAILRGEIETMMAALNGEDKWFLRVVRSDKEDFTNGKLTDHSE